MQAPCGGIGSIPVKAESAKTETNGKMQIFQETVKMTVVRMAPLNPPEDGIG